MEEVHLFILWEKARVQQDRILNDIGQNFDILAQYDVTWTPELVGCNFTRFYGVNLLGHSDKAEHCGEGEFRLIVVLDRTPIYDKRSTSHGLEIVNVRMFDAKVKYRQWTGGGHRVHGTNSAKEANHDLTLLLGINTKDFLQSIDTKKANDDVIRIHQDIVGSNGWKNIEQLFYVLNNTVRYVVIRGVEDLFTGDYEYHTDTDILTDDYYNFWCIANGNPCRSTERPKERITINSINYDLDIWNSERYYYDPIWVDNMLMTRILKDGIYVLNSTNNFYCLLYHCLVNKNHISSDYVTNLLYLKKQFSINENDWYKILVDFLGKNNYDITHPIDKSVGSHLENSVLKSYAYRYGEHLKTMYNEGNVIGYSKVYKKENTYVKVGSDWLIENEIMMLNRLTDLPNFPRVIRSETTNGERVIEITAMDGVDAITFFKHQHLTWSYILSFVDNLLNIIVELHKHSIIHRDLTPNNILLSAEKGRTKVSIIDFGWAVDEKLYKECITPTTLAGGYRPSDGFSDFYTAGMVLKKIFGRKLRTLNYIQNNLFSFKFDDYENTEMLESKITKLQYKFNLIILTVDSFSLFVLQCRSIVVHLRAAILYYIQLLNKCTNRTWAWGKRKINIILNLYR